MEISYRHIDCSENYLDKEIDFLEKIFVENGYKREELRKMVQEVKTKRNQRDIMNVNDNNRENENTQTITLPWIPGVSPKLRKVYRKVGYKVVFKSGRNISNILTARNKTKLPKNSYPGIYKIPCSCGIQPYRGETKKRISTRMNEHKLNVEKQEWGKSGIAQHSKDCHGSIEFENAETVTIIYNKFDRKVRESLEIQKYDCHYKNGGMNPDKGQYVTTKFWIPLLKHLRTSEEIRRNR